MKLCGRRAKARPTDSTRANSVRSSLRYTIELPSLIIRLVLRPNIAEACRGAIALCRYLCRQKQYGEIRIMGGNKCSWQSVEAGFGTGHRESS
jgi:hypothetical protein